MQALLPPRHSSLPLLSGRLLLHSAVCLAMLASTASTRPRNYTVAPLLICPPRQLYYARPKITYLYQVLHSPVDTLLILLGTTHLLLGHPKGDTLHRLPEFFNLAVFVYGTLLALLSPSPHTRPPSCSNAILTLL